MKLRDNIHEINLGYAMELYDRFRLDPGSVDPSTRAYFRDWTPPPEPVQAERVAVAIQKIVGAVRLADAIRGFGHLGAHLDPLGTPPKGDPALLPQAHGITFEDLRELPASLVGGPACTRFNTALEAIECLREIYCASIGFDDEHVHVPEEREWLRDAAESGRYRYPHMLIDFKALLIRLTQVEIFETFLQRIFPGKSRFSIEGVDIMIPMLDEVIGEAAEADIRSILIGMAHRGRLNVLAHVLKLPYVQMLAEFKDPVMMSELLMAMGWTGDVKYHRGASRLMLSNEMMNIEIKIPPNPSHLEAINPVIQGMARAAGARVDRPGPPTFDPNSTLPILIHGDAAFTGQGVVAETLNMSRLPGYTTGGAIHIIANNQLGYTTAPEQDRSTTYASDLAKGFEIPILHVNADDPEACIEAARIAYAYLDRFHKDFLIDLIGYRRHGHNEGDEPSYTQPVMYQVITNHPTVREVWARKLIERAVIGEEWPDELVRRQTGELQRIMEELKPERDLEPPPLTLPTPGMAGRVHTAVPAERLRELNEALLARPDGFTVNPKLRKAYERQARAFDSLAEPTIDWATAEHLAMASILADGIAIRMTGQDAERGTFSHRHAVLVDAKDGERYVPLQSIPQARAAFEIHNSPLSENAAIGFEYGYNVEASDRLVIWEAQYGDFINGAETMVDEFVTSARAKWGQTPSLVLLLPHAFEGQGPDHSSGRVERFLEQAADFNIRIANCTTAAQYFHLLRRQALLLKPDPLPLVVMTPKGLLRHPNTASTVRELAEGRWHPVIDDLRARERREAVRRLVLCSGKIYVDLVTSKLAAEAGAVAIARVEQIYPFPNVELEETINGYPNLEEIVWVQEEPESMGAWFFIKSKMELHFNGRASLHYIGRPRASSPAEGSPAWHSVNQQAIIERTFSLKADDKKKSLLWVKRI